MASADRKSGTTEKEYRLELIHKGDFRGKYISCSVHGKESDFTISFQTHTVQTKVITINAINKGIVDHNPTDQADEEQTEHFQVMMAPGDTGDVNDGLATSTQSCGHANNTATSAEKLEPNGVEAQATPERPNYSAFSKRMKVLIVVMTSLGSLFSPLSSTIYLPALNTISSSLHKSIAAINLTVTSYMIFQGLAPMFFGDLADMVGRRPVYIIAFTTYFFANLGLALQNNYAALFVLRAMQSTGSSATVALGNGVIADVVTSAERGGYIAWVTAGAQLGPALAPTIGGLLAQYLGWHAIFWFLLICGGVYLIAYLIFVPETARIVVGDGSLPGTGWSKPLIYYIHKRRSKTSGLTRTGSQEEKRHVGKELAKTRKLRFPNPLRALRIIVEKDVGFLLFNTSLVITTFQCVFVILPSSFNAIYGLSEVRIGLCYLPFSFGSICGTLCCGRILDYNYRRVARQVGLSVDRKKAEDMRKFPIERARLQVIWYPIIVGQCAIIAWGWVLAARASLAAALVVLSVAGFCVTGANGMLSTFLVDLYPQSPSTATASLNLTRCLLSAAGTAVVQHIVNAWGLGWTFTFLGLVPIAFLPSLWVVTKWGPKWREERYLRLARKAEENREKKERKSLNRNVLEADHLGSTGQSVNQATQR